MTRPARTSNASKILVFAESLNDSKSIASLLVAANGRLSRRVVPVPRPVSLTRAAGADAVRDWVAELKRTVNAYQAAGTRVGGVLVHRDADRFDPLGEVEQSLGRDLKPVPGDPVVPVQTIEAWWFLFPDGGSYRGGPATSSTLRGPRPSSSG